MERIARSKRRRHDRHQPQRPGQQHAGDQRRERPHSQPATGEPYTPRIVPAGDYLSGAGRVLGRRARFRNTAGTLVYDCQLRLGPSPGHQADRRGRARGRRPRVGCEALPGPGRHSPRFGGCGLGSQGWYDYIRPISAIRYMADHGQSSDPDLPSYKAEASV